MDKLLETNLIEIARGIKRIADSLESPKSTTEHRVTALRRQSKAIAYIEKEITKVELNKSKTMNVTTIFTILYAIKAILMERG